jgi:predicted nucleotidyltransferase
MKQSIVNKLKTALPAYPIEKAWIFGSYARGEETHKSDVDLLVRFDKNARISLLGYAHIMNSLTDTLHKKVDLVKEGTLYPSIAQHVEQDKILIYERTD